VKVFLSSNLVKFGSKKNEIYENNDGIIVLCAVPVITDNQIYKNKNMGILIAMNA